MAAEQCLLISALFVLYFTRPPSETGRLLELLEYFTVGFAFTTQVFVYPSSTYFKVLIAFICSSFGLT